MKNEIKTVLAVIVLVTIGILGLLLGLPWVLTGITLLVKHTGNPFVLYDTYVNWVASFAR